MKRIIITIIICLSTLTLIYGQDNEAKKVLNTAIYEEEVNGNLEKAIKLYEEIVSMYPEQRSVVAEALYRSGFANEKLGNLKARTYYEKVINSYSDQPELAQLAQLRLNRILKADKPVIFQKAEDESLSVINLIAEGKDLHSATLSPDGTKLAGMDYTVGQNIGVYNPITNEINLITTYDWGSKGSGWTYYPIWSPDGNEVVHMFADWQGINHEIQITNLEGRTRTLIKNEPNSGQIIPRQWSQDGNKILVFKQDTTELYTIGFVAVNEGTFKPLFKPLWRTQFAIGDAALASLSPDGKYVVFADGAEKERNLYIINTIDREKYVLSEHPSNESSVVWSPDGKHIAFTRETQGGTLLYGIQMKDGKPTGQPFLIKEGLQGANLTSWTEQGICYNLSLDLYDIHTLQLNPETGAPLGEPKPLDYTPTGSNDNATWSHDGQHLAFMSYADLPKIVLMPVEGGKTREYIIPTSGFWRYSMSNLQWLPDNSAVSFFVMNNLGRPIVYHLDIASEKWQNWMLPIQGFTSIVWEPGNHSFYYVKIFDNDPNKKAKDKGIHRFNISTGESNYLFKPEIETYQTLRGMKASRDYKKITFLFNSRIYMLWDLESGECKELSRTHYFPSFSPNGQKILALSKNYSLNLLSLEGEVLQQYSLAKYFTSGTRISSCDWSPDGKQFIFTTRNIKFGTYLIKNIFN